jgi:hypothetical protein
MAIAHPCVSHAVTDSSARFEGSLNVDLNEITMNLVPFPRMHYLMAAQAPLYSLLDVHIPPRRSVAGSLSPSPRC